jgi:DNA-binding transcriptional ArsR family regulator
MTQAQLLAWLRALGEESRLQVVLILRQLGACHGHELLDRLPDLSQPGLSRHLAILREAGLLEGKKEGREILYSLIDSPLLTHVLIDIKYSDSSQKIIQTVYESPPEKVIDPIPEEEFQDWLQ